MSEIWKELEGFSKYKISNTGKIWSKSRNREMSLKPKEDGYICVGLINNIVETTPFKKALKGITKINTELLRVSDIMSI